VSLERGFAEAERTAELLDVARAERPLEELADDGQEVVKGADRRQGRGEGVVSDAACRGDDEGVRDDVERTCWS